MKLGTVIKFCFRAQNATNKQSYLKEWLFQFIFSTIAIVQLYGLVLCILTTHPDAYLGLAWFLYYVVYVLFNFVIALCIRNNVVRRRLSYLDMPHFYVWLFVLPPISYMFEAYLYFCKEQMQN